MHVFLFFLLCSLSGSFLDAKESARHAFGLLSHCQLLPSIPEGMDSGTSGHNAKKGIKIWLILRDKMGEATPEAEM